MHKNLYNKFSAKKSVLISESYHEAFLSQPLEKLGPYQEREQPKCRPEAAALSAAAQKISPPTPFADSANSCFSKYQPSPGNSVLPTYQKPGSIVTK